jgi:hypothetical protein
MTHLGNSCDSEQVSRFCLISGINTSNLSGGTLPDVLIAKLRKAAKGYKVTASPDEEYLTEIKYKRHRAMKLSTMGWKEVKNEKSMIVVKLAAPILIGITMAGGRRRYERVCVSPSGDSNEWYCRQFLSDKEADFFNEMSTKPMQTSTNVIMGGVRGLPRVAEFD